MANVEQYILLFKRNDAIAARGYIQQQRTIFTDIVNQFAQDGFRPKVIDETRVLVKPIIFTHVFLRQGAQPDNASFIRRHVKGYFCKSVANVRTAYRNDLSVVRIPDLYHSISFYCCCSCQPFVAFIEKEIDISVFQMTMYVFDGRTWFVKNYIRHR